MHYWVSQGGRPALVPRGDLWRAASFLCSFFFFFYPGEHACLGHPSWTGPVAEERHEGAFLFYLFMQCLNNTAEKTPVENTCLYEIVWPYEYIRITYIRYDPWLDRGLISFNQCGWKAGEWLGEVFTFKHWDIYDNWKYQGSVSGKTSASWRFKSCQKVSKLNSVHFLLKAI